MIQKYLLTIEGNNLSKDMSKDLAQEFTAECFVGEDISRIKVEKIIK